MVEVLWNVGQHFSTVREKLDKFSTLRGDVVFLTPKEQAAGAEARFIWRCYGPTEVGP